MSEIDPEKLEQALKTVALAEGYMSSYQQIIVNAARAHLSTLPRFKEVEVVRWGILDPAGDYRGTFSTEAGALRECPIGHQVVRLTGTAKVKVPA